MPADIIRFCCCVILLLLVDVVIVHVDLSIVKRSLIVAAVLALLNCGCDAMLLLLLPSSGWCCYIFSLPIGVITRSCNAVFVARVIGIVRRRQNEKGKGKWGRQVGRSSPCGEEDLEKEQGGSREFDCCGWY